MAIKQYFNHMKKTEEQKHGECKVIFGSKKKRKIKLTTQQRLDKKIAFDNSRKDWKGNYEYKNYDRNY